MTYKQLTDRMALEMLAALRQGKCDGKSGWQTMERHYSQRQYCQRRLLEEVIELLERPSWKEAADVANFAAFLVVNEGTEEK